MYLQQEALLRPDLEGKEAEVCLPCYHIYRFLEQHFYKQGQESTLESDHESSVQPDNEAGFVNGPITGDEQSDIPKFESSHNRRGEA